MCPGWSLTWAEGPGCALDAVGLVGPTQPVQGKGVLLEYRLGFSFHLRMSLGRTKTVLLSSLGFANYGGPDVFSSSLFCLVLFILLGGGELALVQ